MAIVFKYKNATSLSYAPGFTNAGVDGDEGMQGVSGNTVYFVDYDLDNSYSIQLALQRIENNQLLSSTSNKNISDRPYKENDLLMSKSGNIYQIVLANQTSAQNYKFDIKPLGSLHDAKASLSISKVIIYNITNKSITVLDEDNNSHIETYDTVSYSPAFTNRTNKLIFDNITKEDKKLYGGWFKIFLVVEIGIATDDTIEKYFTLTRELLNEYSFDLSILLNCKKSLQQNSIPVEMGTDINALLDPSPKELYQCFDMYKKLEFTNLMVVPKIYDDTFDTLVDREMYFANTYHIKPTFPNRLLNSFYLSDFAMDKMHPAGNNIRCTLEKDRWIWYKTGIDSSDTFNLYINPVGDAYVYPYLEENATPSREETKYSKCEMTDIKYFYNMVGTKTAVPSNISTNIFPKYAIGRSLTEHTGVEAQDILNDLDAKNTNLIQRSQRYIGKSNILAKNPRAGDSAYFSSMPGELVADEIAKYLRNTSNNKYILTIKNKKTKEISTAEIPVEFYDA